ncbi:hypothetical protein CIPAW_07G079200 [Carya illinoinensis]|uniref:Uncharacterized protein n=1 Tax=Carya illinoinensis TaxID=32201 RepID=A0A8T1PW80_CARIL|nr:hypothetical protein CIPAW_07G079200 [Carya illinoinensis]
MKGEGEHRNEKEANLGRGNSPYKKYLERKRDKGCLVFIWKLDRWENKPIPHAFDHCLGLGLGIAREGRGRAWGEKLGRGIYGEMKCTVSCVYETSLTSIKRTILFTPKWCI